MEHWRALDPRVLDGQLFPPTSAAFAAEAPILTLWKVRAPQFLPAHEHTGVVGLRRAHGIDNAAVWCGLGRVPGTGMALPAPWHAVARAMPYGTQIEHGMHAIAMSCIALPSPAWRHGIAWHPRYGEPRAGLT